LQPGVASPLHPLTDCPRMHEHDARPVLMLCTRVCPCTDPHEQRKDRPCPARGSSTRAAPAAKMRLNRGPLPVLVLGCTLAAHACFEAAQLAPLAAPHTQAPQPLSANRCKTAQQKGTVDCTRPAAATPADAVDTQAAPTTQGNRCIHPGWQCHHQQQHHCLLWNVGYWIRRGFTITQPTKTRTATQAASTWPTSGLPGSCCLCTARVAAALLVASRRLQLPGSCCSALPGVKVVARLPRGAQLPAHLSCKWVASRCNPTAVSHAASTSKARMTKSVQ
jgi:hypothetical protein